MLHTTLNGLDLRLLKVNQAIVHVCVFKLSFTPLPPSPHKPLSLFLSPSPFSLSAPLSPPPPTHTHVPSHSHSHPIPSSVGRVNKSMYVYMLNPPAS